MLDFWAKTSGTWINVATVLLGTALGLLLTGHLPERMQRMIKQGLGLTTLFIGISMAGSLNQSRGGIVDGVILGLLALVAGGLLGEWWQIEERLAIAGDWLKHRVKGKGRFTDGFVTASLLFCIGPMAMIGSLNNGLVGDARLLTLKATMDGLAAIALTGSYGIGVGFSTLTILLYQGGLSLAAGLLARALPDPASSPPVLLATGVGGLMILSIGLNLLEIGKVRVGSFLPAPFLAPLVYWLATWLTAAFA
ncbi:DUF554 domain-containing protein [Leptolyngbya sp. O-77]|uniref:DUF554 domain-containing protein n=1 Tax=Leptolyngbya sp. O-77 TaxID=1080068 RepID=UPI00074D4826|nr:DUF554 domain-containing protein [Leptolyngbya sp. O-77]BAU42439.1 putative membrane protein YdfK [Leptolyngbya sp. O-77]